MAKAQKTGRPEIDFDWLRLNKLCQYPLSQDDIAECMGMSKDTIARRILEMFDMSFAAYHNKKKARMRKTLMAWQFKAARTGNITMLIWLGKQYLEQKDQVESKSTTEQKIIWKVNWADESDDGNHAATPATDPAPKADQPE